MRPAPCPIACSPQRLGVALVAAFRSGIDSLFEDSGRLEHHHPAWRDRYFLAGLGIAPDALAFLADNEGTKRRQLHRFAALEAVGDFLEHLFNEGGRLGARQT